MKVLLLGKNGQVGRAVQALPLSANWPKNWTLSVVSTEELGGFGLTSLREILSRENPDVIWNTIAYTAVDLAETNHQDAKALNETLPTVLGRWCAEKNRVLVHYSTDYVYPGNGERPWQESDPTGPLSVYGQTKLAGDLAILESRGKALIFRTSWVYDVDGKNFVNTMLRLAKDRKELRVVSDQWGGPTYAKDIAEISLQCLRKALEASEKFPSGVYHLCNDGFTNWAEFASEILRGTGVQIHPIPSSDYPTPARRPLNSRLSLEKLRTTFDLAPRHWKDALAEVLGVKKGNS